MEECTEFAMRDLRVCQFHSNLDPINFNEAHNAWMRNKTKQKSSYKYVCGVLNSKSQYCKKKIYKNQTDKQFNTTCRGHFRNSL